MRQSLQQGPDPPFPTPATLDPNPSPPEQPLPTRQLHPLPKGLVELYGLLAVLFVLVPEWMAGGALGRFKEGRDGSQLPVTASAWRRVPELRLAAMGLAELRQLEEGAEERPVRHRVRRHGEGEEDLRVRHPLHRVHVRREEEGAFRYAP